MSKAKTFTAPHPVYTGGRMYAAGEPFTTDDKPGKEWDAVDKAEKAAIEASQKQTQDVDYEGLALAALQAIAAEKGVNPKGLSKPDLITAIKAADEPRL